MGRCEVFVWEGIERSSQFFKLCKVFNAGKNLLADWANNGYTTVLDRVRERCEYQLLIAANGSFLFAP